MNRFETQVKSNQLFPLYTNFKNLYSNLNISNYDNEDVIIELIRIGKVINFMDTVFEELDYDITSLNVLNNIFSALNPAYSSLTTFISSGGMNYLISCNDNLTNVIPHLHSINILKKNTSKRATIRNINELNNTIESLINSYANYKSEIGMSKNDFESKIKELEKNIVTQTTRIDNVVTDAQSRFIDNQLNRNTEFSKLLKEFDVNINVKFDEFNNFTETEVNEILDKAKHSIEEYYKTSDNIINSLNENKDKSFELLKIITNVGTSGQFSKYAKSEEKKYNIFSLVALFFMSIAIVMSYFLLVNNSDSATLIATISKIFTISLFFAPATYAVKEASKYRKRESFYRKMELELATIDTFIESISSENRENIKVELTRKLFGSSWENVESVEKNKSSEDPSIRDILEIFSDLGIKKEALFELIRIIKN